VRVKQVVSEAAGASAMPSMSGARTCKAEGPSKNDLSPAPDQKLSMLVEIRPVWPFGSKEVTYAKVPSLFTWYCSW